MINSLGNASGFVAPYLTGWIEELGGIIKREIVRVVANPRDIERYRREFFGVSSSIKGAVSGGGERHLGLNNLEALVELGKAGQALGVPGVGRRIVDGQQRRVSMLLNF